MPESSDPNLAIEMDVLSSPDDRTNSKLPPRNGSDGRKDYIVGIVLLLGVVVLWTASNFLTQDLFEDGYEKPFLMTYLSTSTFSLYLLPVFIRHALSKDARERGTNAERGIDYQPLATQDVLRELDAEDTITPDKESLPPLTRRETAVLAAQFCFLWFLANWTVNVSLEFTSVASATILSSMSGFFTLCIGRIFRVETLTLVKLGAVITSFGGVIMVSLSDSSQPQKTPASPVPSSSHPLSAVPFFSYPLLGDSLALLSALLYATYVTLLKYRIRTESRVDMQLFFGFVGLFNILACWPIGVILHLTGVERFELPYTSKIVVALLINMSITLSSDYIYVLAMLKTTPLVVTVGLSLTMPLAVIGDFVLKKPVKPQVIAGAAVVLLSFIAVGLQDVDNEAELGGEQAVETELPAAVRLDGSDVENNF